jgi:hypothetical protein
VKPGDVLVCEACGASSLPLHTTGGRRWEEGGALVATWPDRTLSQGRHEIVDDRVPGVVLCLGCNDRKLDGAPAAAPGSGAALPAPMPLAPYTATDVQRDLAAGLERAAASPAGRALAAAADAMLAPALSALERFEALAEAFRLETGLLAPGKDAPAAAGGFPTEEERAARWLAWCAERNRAAAAARPARTPPPPKGQLGLF